MVKKNTFSILVALLIMSLSLTGSDTFKKVSISNVPHLDKLVHLGMYFFWMSVIIFENRKGIKNTSQLFLIAIIPFCFGVLMEVLQSLFITSRDGNAYDVIFNLAGILISLFLWLWIKPFISNYFR